MDFNLITLGMPSASDSSVQTLYQIIGPVIHSIIGSPDLPDPNGALPALTLFAKMLRTFNNFLLGFGTIIFAIMLFVGTMNSAADGQFLGRNWNSMWTPFRLVLGLLFLVPLNSGFCVGQYVFLYIILIGVKIATGVWTEVVLDVFKNSTPPVVPTYVTQFTLKVIEEQMILDAVKNINAKMSTEDCKVDHCSAITVKVDTVYNMGDSIPGPILQLIKDKSYYACLAVYRGLADACRAAIPSLITTKPEGQSSSTHYPSMVLPSFSATLNAWFSSTPAPSTLDDTPTTFWPDADGKIHILGHYYYNFDAKETEIVADMHGIPPDMQDTFNRLAGVGDYVGKGDSFSKNLNEAVHDFSNDMIYPSSADLHHDDPRLKNMCQTEDGQANTACSLQPLAASAVSHAFSLIEEYNAQYAKGGRGGEGAAAYVRYASPHYECSTVTAANGAETRSCELKPADSGGVVDPTGEQNDYAYFAIQGIAYTDNNGNVRQDIVKVPLLGSWWNAGQSYLIMDAQFANNIQLLIDFLKLDEINFSVGSNVEGELAITYHLGLMETGHYYDNGTFNSAHPAFMDANCVAYSVSVATPGEVRTSFPFTMQSCYLDQMRFITPIDYNIDLASRKWMLKDQPPTRGPIDLSELDLGSEWGVDILPYMPKANVLLPQRDQNAGDRGEVDDPAKLMKNFLLPDDYYTVNSSTLERFYKQLNAVPVEFQAPLDFILKDAQQVQASNNSSVCGTGGTKIPCYLFVMPYLQNLMNVLSANGLLNQTGQDALPVNQAMNSMFDNLLGGGGDDTQSVSGGAVGLNSIMQQVYSLGTSSTNNIFASQFSLIQQTRNVGIGVIVTCLNAMTTVYGHYTTLMTDMIDKVNKVANDTSALDLAQWSGIPIVGSAIGGFAAASEAQQQLQIMTTTVTTMSNIGIQLMWMPLFLFVMTSLFAIGVQFAMLIPFMPYIMFWAGEIAWVLGVLEAVIAAPLVMLGIAHPGGNEYLGHGNGAVRMLIGIVFRPVLMVIGMIMGIMLTYVLITFSADGFHIIAASTFNAMPTDNMMLSGTVSCLLLFTYGSFLVMAFTKCFSPIYMIPEKVVEWIGGSAAKAGEQEAQQFSSSVQQTAEKGASAGGQAMQQGVQAQESKGQKMSDLGAQSNKAAFESTSAISKGIGDSAQQAGSVAMKMV